MLRAERGRQSGRMYPRTQWTAAWMIALLAVAGGVEEQRLNEVDQGGQQSSEPRLVCYYSNWAVYRPGLAKFTPENIHPYLCTHVIYAFASLSEEFRVQPFDPYNDMEQGNYRSFVSLKAYNPHLKTMVAVGGWNEGSRRFSRLVESAERRAAFVESCLAFLRQHAFDGIDLDWEYPAFREGGNRTTDRKGYALLVKELRQAIDAERLPAEKERLLLSVAVPATKSYIDQGFDVPEIARYAHFLNLLTYDYHSAYEPETHHHAPLYPPPDLSPLDDRNQLNVAWTVDYYLSLGAPAHKLVVGIPMYGRSYTLSDPRLSAGFDAPARSPGDEGAATREKGYLAFYEICQRVKEEEWEVEAPTPRLLGPYAYKKDQWVGFDDEEMVFNKAKFILERGLGGAMVWTLDNDDFRGVCTGEQSPLVNTLRDVLLHTNLIEGGSSQQSSVARSAEPRAEVRFDDDEGIPRRRNTLRRFVNDRQSNRQTASRRLISDGAESNHLSDTTTPEPPSTPDPGTGAFECQDEGFFNNPRDCKKYFWCLDSGPANLGVVAHAFTCPSGLHFNSGSESCDYPDNVVCPVGSIGASARTSKPRTRTSGATSTTTPSPASTSEAPATKEKVTQETPAGGGENLAELLRLLQAIGGVERLQNILGAQDQASSIRSHNTALPTLPQYVTPHRSTTAEQVRSTAPPPSTLPDTQPNLFLDPYDPYGVSEDFSPNESEDEDFFQYHTPAAAPKPEVVYASDEKDGTETTTRETSPAAPVTTPVPPSGPYRTPIRVQVGRVVRVQNGAAQPNATTGERRRMLVRIRGPNRTLDEESEPRSEGRAVGDRRLSGSTLLATRADPIGDPVVAVRRRPAPALAEDRQGVRYVARRPNTLPQESERGSYVTVRRRPTTPELTTTTSTTTPAPTPPSPQPEPVYLPHNHSSEEYDDEYEYYEDYEDDTTTAAPTTTTTTTTTTKRPTASLSNRRRFSASPQSSTATTSKPVASTSTPRGSRGPSGTTPPAPSDDPVAVRSDDDVDCFKRGVFLHPGECSKFVVCAPASRGAGNALKGRVLNCPANQIYLVDIGRCMKGDRNKCQKL